MAKLNQSKLRKWSLLIRGRDKFECYVCSNKFSLSETEAHHVYPKHLYPRKAYSLSNGVCVCKSCHQPLIHSTKKSWRKFTCFFKRHLNKKAIKSFNRVNNKKVSNRVVKKKSTRRRSRKKK
jgi:hypothetical protein